MEVRRRGKHPAAIVWSPLNKRRYHRGPGSPGLHTAARGAAASGRLPRSDSKRVSSTMNESPPPPLPYTHTQTNKSKISCLSLPALRSYLFVPFSRPPLRLCIRLLGNSCPGIEANNLSFSWKIISFHRYLVHSKILPSLEIVENCFFLTLLFTSF